MDLLSSRYGTGVHLDVYSSFELYGWKQRDEAFEELFQLLRSKSNVTLHGTQSNENLRQKLESTHIMAYPSCVTKDLETLPLQFRLPNRDKA